MPVIIVLVALIVAVFLVVQFWPLALAIAIIWAGAVIIPKVVRNIRK
ncbi:HNH endonuclease, partial [Burkholderia multivorans]